MYVEGYTVVSPRALVIDANEVDVKIEVDTLSTIRGRVMHKGAPVPDAFVVCPGKSVYADDDGAFVCTGVYAGAHYIVAKEPGGNWAIPS